MRLCVYEDAGVANLEPLSLTRPAFDLRLGTCTQLERLRRAFPTPEVGVVVRPAHAELCRQRHPDLAVNDRDWLRRGPVLFVNARWLPPASLTVPEAGACGLVNDQTAYALLPAVAREDATPESVAAQIEQHRRQHAPPQAGGSMLRYPWDLVERNPDALAQDYTSWRAERSAADRAGVSIVGPRESVVVDPSARIEPFVLLDATRGPVLIDRDAQVQAFSRLEGPCYVGPETQLHAARLRGGSLGPQCRVGGEVEASVLASFVNKYHDGFLGHSYVGEWVNFGAGSHTSDLRTDYGPITMTINGSQVPTGLAKIGAYLGDYTRMSIGTLLNTGTVVGPFGLLLTSGTLLPRVIPSFCRYGHGRIEEQSNLRQMFATAKTMMGRRNQEWTEAHADFYFALFEQTASERVRVLRDGEQARLRRVM